MTDKHPDLFSDYPLLPDVNNQSTEKQIPAQKSRISLKKTQKTKDELLVLDKMKEIGSFLSPYSNTTPSKDDSKTHDVIVKQPQIKIVPFGTGTGKTYSSILSYIKLQSMDFDLKKKTEGILIRNKGDRNFTNGVFVTPIKSQMKADKELVLMMQEVGITPVSYLAITDITNPETKLWLSDTGITLKQRLVDYKSVILKLRKTINTVKKCKDHGVEWWAYGNINAMLSEIIKIIYCFDEFERTEKAYSYNQISEKEYDFKIREVRNRHLKHITKLILCVLNNNPSKLHSNFKSEDENESDVASTSHEGIEEGVDSIQSEEDANDAIQKVKTYAYSESQVYSEIFEKSLKKSHFDELLSITFEECDDVVSMIATLKKDILRVYAPLDFSSYTPSFICMTSHKYKQRPSLCRFSRSKGEVGKRWVRSSMYSNFAEMVGNKVGFNKAISALPPNATDETKAEILRETLMETRRDNRGEEGGVDDRTVFARKGIDFYIIIDESNDLFELDMMDNKTVVKRLLPDFSITDVMSCVERKYRELVESNIKNTEIHCKKATALFFWYMKNYIEKYCDIPVEKVLGEKGASVFLSKFVSLSNVLYIKNSEADLLINIAENAFTASAKNFIEKGKLQSIYLHKEGYHGFLSLDKSADGITLYDVYQVLIAVLYACIKIGETPSLSSPDKKDFQIDLGFQKQGSEKVRQNSPLQTILAYAINHHQEYVHWLESDSLDGDGDEVLDEWYAYIQTKLVFSITIDKTFDDSTDEGHKTKTFIDIGLSLVKQHPELDLLRMVEGTSNQVAIMSATAGREVAYSCQYNIGFLRRWGEILDVKVMLPEYDNYYQVDYRESFKDLRRLHSNNRTITIHPVDGVKEIVSLLDEMQASNEVRQMSVARKIGSNKAKSSYHLINKVRNHLVDTSSNIGKPIDDGLYSGSYNDQAFDLGVGFLLYAFRQRQTSLHSSLRSNITYGFINSIKQETLNSNNSSLLKIALGEKKHPVFVHSLFGEYSLPLLNEYLGDFGDKKRTKLEVIRRQIRNKFCYIVDFLDVPSTFGIPEDSIIRLALYDSNVDKIYSDYKSNFKIYNTFYKGVKKTLYTHILSYNRVISVGLNNTIYNHIEDREEDINNIFLSTLSFYSPIKKKRTKDFSDNKNEYNNIHNALFYMRHLADPEHQFMRTLVREFDSSLGTKQAREFLNTEHGYHINNALKQTNGRGERRGGVKNFKSNIYLPKANFIEQVRIEYDSADFNSRNVPTRNKIDYEFMSMTNQAFYEQGMDFVKGESLSSEERSQLEQESIDCINDIHEFTSNIMSKILNIARSGDKNENARVLADKAIAFDLAYREPTILSNPVQWKQKLKQVLLDNSDLVSALDISYEFLSRTIDSMYIDTSRFKAGIDLYQHENGGLTDFFGDRIPFSEPYSPYKNVVKDMKKTVQDSIYKTISGVKRSSLGNRLESLIKFNNSMTKKDSAFYSNNENKSLLLHPKMLHMALGNLGELVFDKFVELYDGKYRQLNVNEALENFGYQSYEFCDFWLKKEDGSYVCVDVKNMSHSKNKKQTKNHYNQQDRKIAKIKESLEGVGHPKLSSTIFESGNKVDIFYVNIRDSLDANSRKRIDKYVVGSSEYEFHVHNICLFQAFRYMNNKDSSYKSNERHWTGFLSADIINLLGIKLNKDDEANNAVESGFVKKTNNTNGSVFDCIDSLLTTEDLEVFGKH